MASVVVVHLEVLNCYTTNFFNGFQCFLKTQLPTAADAVSWRKSIDVKITTRVSIPFLNGGCRSAATLATWSWRVEYLMVVTKNSQLAPSIILWWGFLWELQSKPPRQQQQWQQRVTRENLSGNFDWVILLLQQQPGSRPPNFVMAAWHKQLLLIDGFWVWNLWSQCISFEIESSKSGPPKFRNWAKLPLFSDIARWEVCS